MKALTTTRQIGGSLVATIPKNVVKEEGFLPGQLIEIEVRRPKKSFFGITPDIGTFTREDELDTHG